MSVPVPAMMFPSESVRAMAGISEEAVFLHSWEISRVLITK